LLLLLGCRTEAPAKLGISFPPSEADFTATPTQGFIPFTVTFTNQSKGSISQWHWDFGDGKFSNELAPVHIYTTAGKFTVSLTVTGPGGSNTKTKVDYIEAKLEVISWEEAWRYIGQTKVVEGIVVDAKYAVTSKGQPTFLNIGKPYPQPGRFTILIWGSDRPKFAAKFPPNPETYLLNKRIQVTGVIGEYPKGSGNPEVILSDPSQIKVIE